MSVFDGMQPANVWKHFEALCGIPGASIVRKFSSKCLISPRERDRQLGGLVFWAAAQEIVKCP